MLIHGTPGLDPIVLSAAAFGLNARTELNMPTVSRLAADRFPLMAMPRPLNCSRVINADDIRLGEARSDGESGGYGIVADASRPGDKSLLRISGDCLISWQALQFSPGVDRGVADSGGAPIRSSN